MNFREKLLAIATGSALLCAFIVTGLIVRRELFGGQIQGVRAEQPAPREIENWTTFLEGGHRMGSTTAKVLIVEFADFECPFCQVFATQTLTWIRERYPEDVAVVFRHWPLPNHRFAYPTARAAECASNQGRFEAMHDALFAQQDSFGLKAFGTFALEAGVADTSAFAECMRVPGPLAAIERDMAAAKELGTRGTPTIVMNGRNLSMVMGRVV